VLAKRLGDQAAAGQTLADFARDLLEEVVAVDDEDDEAVAEAFACTRRAIPAEKVVEWLKAGGDVRCMPFPKASLSEGPSAP